MSTTTEDYSSGHLERGSGSSNSRTSSVAESVIIPTDGFSNYFDIIQHLQTVWNNHHHIHENPSRRDENHTSHYSKGHSQQHHSHHQYYNNYNNSRRTGGGNYSRGYNHDGYWNNSKNTRFTNHRSVNSLMNNNYQQQQSPPIQRRPGEQTSQPYYKKHRSDHDRRMNGYHSQNTSDYTLNSHQQIPNISSESSNLTSTQSFPNNLNSYNR